MQASWQSPDASGKMTRMRSGVESPKLPQIRGNCRIFQKIPPAGMTGEEGSGAEPLCTVYCILATCNGAELLSTAHCVLATCLERATGFEPVPPAWKAGALPTELCPLGRLSMRSVARFLVEVAGIEPASGKVPRGKMSDQSFFWNGFCADEKKNKNSTKKDAKES